MGMPLGQSEGRSVGGEGSTPPSSNSLPAREWQITAVLQFPALCPWCCE